VAAALEILEQPGVHIKGALARNAAGFGVSPKDPTACGFCAIGAMRKVGVSEATMFTMCCFIDPEWREKHRESIANQPIWMINDKVGVHVIRQLMQDFVHAEIEHVKDLTP
jgi:hypothetical protein